MKKLITFILSIIILIIIIIEAVIFLRIGRLPFVQVTLLGATHSLTHWISWIGTLFIAFSTPIQPIVKRKFPKHTQNILKIHMIGNLIAVLLVSIHFAHQVTRPDYTNFNTGLILYTAMILLVSTGFIMYSGLAKKFYKQTLFFHPAFAISFYMVIIIHIIQNGL